MICVYTIARRWRCLRARRAGWSRRRRLRTTSRRCGARWATTGPTKRAAMACPATRQRTTGRAAALTILTRSSRRRARRRRRRPSHLSTPDLSPNSIARYVLILYFFFLLLVHGDLVFQRLMFLCNGYICNTSKVIKIVNEIKMYIFHVLSFSCCTADY